LRIGLVNEYTDPVRLLISHTEGKKLHCNMIHAVNTKINTLLVEHDTCRKWICFVTI